MLPIHHCHNQFLISKAKTPQTRWSPPKQHQKRVKQRSFRWLSRRHKNNKTTRTPKIWGYYRVWISKAPSQITNSSRWNSRLASKASTRYFSSIKRRMNTKIPFLCPSTTLPALCWILAWVTTSNQEAMSPNASWFVANVSWPKENDPVSFSGQRR